MRGIESSEAEVDVDKAGGIFVLSLLGFAAKTSGISKVISPIKEGASFRHVVPL